MLLGPLTHPEILSALGRAGHGAKVLVGDGNYPHSVGAPGAARVFLNLAPGLLGVDTILTVLRDAVPVERAAVMVPAPDALPEHRPDRIESHDAYRALLPDVPFDELPRFDFYDAARDEDVALVIASGDQRLYANILLTIGTRAP